MSRARPALIGTVYLIHFDQPYQHARHYLGWTEDITARLTAHAAGRGSRLMAVIKAAEIQWQLARTWPGTRARERQIKRQGGASRVCPLCGVTPAADTDRVALATLADEFPQFTQPGIGVTA